MQLSCVKAVDAHIIRAGIAQSVMATGYGQNILLSSAASRPAMRPTQPAIQWVPGALSLWQKRLEREADHSPPCGTEVKNYEAIHPLPNMPSWREN
jgi:hypothetical protein